MSTVGDILTLALNDSGILGQGQIASAEDLNNALTRANMMLYQWDRERWVVYHLQGTGCSTTGAASYTLGPGGDLNIQRLDRIDAAAIRDSNNNDTSLKIIRSKEEYDRISQKSQVGTPQYIFYDSNNPTGNVFLWPNPGTGFTLTVEGKVQLQVFNNLTDTITLPPEYLEAIYSNLIVRLRAAYRLPPDEYYVKLAETTLEVLKNANLQNSMLRYPKIADRSVGDLINLALEDSGVFNAEKPPSLQDTLDGLWRLNQMLAQWNRKRWLVYHLVDSVVTTTGAVSYTIGPGQQFNTPRPDRLEDGCFLRQLNTSGGQQVDYPLQVLSSREDYNRIRLKNMGTWPAVVFYDSNWPTGLVYAWPVPAANLYELHILVKSQLTQFTSIFDTINLPPEYEAALSYNLQMRIRSAYGLPPDPTISALAKESLSVIRGANVQVPTAKMPPAVIGAQRGYNVYSDGY